MANINEILARAAALRNETALNSIDPERAGGIMYDTLLALNELWLQQGAALVISKIYASVAAMNADTSPVSDLTGKPIRPGMVVVIASSDSDNGSVYRYNGTSSPRWSLVGKIGNITPEDSLTSDSTQLPLAAHQGKVLDGKISQLGQYVDNPEWVKVVTDSEDKILYGVKTDGKFYFGAGCPPQVVDYVNTSISDYGYNKSTIDSLLNNKVDKVEGKSLIDKQYADGVSTGVDVKHIEIKTDLAGKSLEHTDRLGEKTIDTDLSVYGNVAFNKDVEIDDGDKLQESLSKNASSILALNPFWYYYPRLVNMNSRKKNSNIKPLVLCHISDIHGQADQYDRIVSFLHQYAGYYDDVLLTGDIVAEQFGDSISFLDAYENKALLVIGNHDAWERNALPIVIVSAKDDYDKFIAPFVANWGVTQPLNASSGKCYYYKDYIQSNIRLIVADCMHDSQEQLDFIVSALESAKNSGMSVIISQHYPAGDYIPSGVSFDSLDSDGLGLESNGAYLNAVDAFIEDGGKFICWLCGHYHQDYFGYIIGHPNQLQICINCAKLASDSDTARLLCARTRDCFNFYSFDEETGLFTILRVGATIDRHLQKRESIVYDYVNKQILK